MRLFYVKEGRGQHAAALFDETGGPYRAVALFHSERDARRFVEAGNRSMTDAEAARKRLGMKAVRDEAPSLP